MAGCGVGALDKALSKTVWVFPLSRRMLFPLAWVINPSSSVVIEFDLTLILPQASEPICRFHRSIGPEALKRSSFDFQMRSKTFAQVHTSRQAYLNPV